MSSPLKLWLTGERGRVMGLAKHLNVPPSFVTRMGEGDKAVPVSHAAAIEQITGGAVTRKQLFPEDWQRIWPELASADSTEAKAA